MGYELEMKVGWLGGPSVEHKRKERLELEEDGKSAWFPYVKDADDDFVPSGRMERHFFEVANVDLCKIYDSETSKVATASFRKKAPQVVIKWFRGNDDEETDSYGDYPTPVPLSKVIKALKKDCKNLEYSDSTLPYRRFEWALALLEAIDKRDESKNKEFVVLFYGH